MNITSLINEYKKINFNNPKNGNSKKIFFNGVIFFISCLYTVYFMNFFLSPDQEIFNHIVFTLTVLFLFLLSIPIIKKILITYAKKHDRMTYIELFLNDKIFTGVLTDIINKSESKILYIGEYGMPLELYDIRKNIILNEGIHCKHILYGIKKHFTEHHKEQQQKEFQEVRDVLKKEETPLGKMFDFVDKIE